MVDKMAELGLDIYEWGIPGHEAWGSPLASVIPMPGKLPIPMYGVRATGLGLAGGEHLGCDLIHVEAGDGFSPHTHPGDHLLVVVAGRGTVTWNGRIWPTRPGLVYFVPGNEPHAVGAIDDHTILAVGAPHRPVGSADRQTLVAYQAVAASLGVLTCLVCALTGHPSELRDAGCTHAPEDRLDDEATRVILLSALPLDADAQRRIEQVADVPAGKLADAFELRNLLPVDVDNDTLRTVPDLVPHALELIPGRLVIGVGLDGVLPGGVNETNGRHVLAVNVLHPHLWDGHDFAEMAKLLRSARTMAAGGPPSFQWRHDDYQALLAVTGFGTRLP